MEEQNRCTQNDIEDITIKSIRDAPDGVLRVATLHNLSKIKWR